MLGERVLTRITLKFTEPLMTVYVKDASKSVLSGLSKMKATMIADYADFGGTPSRTLRLK